MKIYKFKVSLDHDKRTYRNIEILSTQTLDDFHETIFSAFDRDDEHLYSFYITSKQVRNRHARSKSPEFTDPAWFEDDFNSGYGQQKYNAADIDIGSLELKLKDKIYYLFDFGDCWWHEITLLSIQNTNDIKGFPKIVKRSGDSPQQYPDYDEEDF